MGVQSFILKVGLNREETPKLTQQVFPGIGKRTYARGTNFGMEKKIQGGKRDTLSNLGGKSG